MPRLARYLLPERGIFHVTTRGVARQAISRDDEDRRLFLVLLARATRRTNWGCHAFCLMPNHHHVIVETHQDLLSVGLRQLNGRYAQAFNERHERTGHLFGDRFAAFVIRDEEHLRGRGRVRRPEPRPRGPLPPSRRLAVERRAPATILPRCRRMT